MCKGVRRALTPETGGYQEEGNGFQQLSELLCASHSSNLYIYWIPFITALNHNTTLILSMFPTLN